MAADTALIRQIQAQREAWKDVPGQPGRRLLLRRPAEAEIPRVLGLPPAQAAAEVVVDWKGYSRATLLGAGIGSSDPEPFSPEVWAAYIADNVALIEQITRWITELVTAHLQAREAVAKNSAAS